MLSIKVASGITAIAALLCSGYHYLSIKSGVINKVLTDQGFEFIENLPFKDKQKIYQNSFKRNKEYIKSRQEFLKGTTYELKDFEDDEEGGIALSYWCKDVIDKSVRANSGHHLIYATQWCTLSFEDKLLSEELTWDDSTVIEEWREKVEGIGEIIDLDDAEIDEKVMNWCNAKKNTIFSNLSKKDYEASKCICTNIDYS